MLILKFGYILNIKIFCEQNMSEFILKRGIYKVFDYDDFRKNRGIESEDEIDYDFDYSYDYPYEDEYDDSDRYYF